MSCACAVSGNRFHSYFPLIFLILFVESERKIRNLETDKQHLQSHNDSLQNQLDALLTKQLVSSTTAKKVQTGISRQSRSKEHSHQWA